MAIQFLLCSSDMALILAKAAVYYKDCSTRVQNRSNLDERRNFFLKNKPFKSIVYLLLLPLMLLDFFLSEVLCYLENCLPLIFQKDQLSFYFCTLPKFDGLIEGVYEVGSEHGLFCRCSHYPSLCL